MRFRLHDHQQNAIAALRQSLATGHKRPMLMAPTGAGKTVIGSAIVEGALAKGKRVLFTVPFLSLVDQTVAAFNAQGIEAIGIMQGNHPGTDGSQPVQVASVQTLMRRKLPDADIVLVDEAHRWFAFYAKWMSMPEWQRIPFVGLSATPWAKGLGRHYDDLIVAATTTELIERGFLSPYRVYAPAHPDLTGVKTVAGDYHEGQLSEVMRQPVLVAGIVDTWLKLGEDRPTLAFCVDRAHARRVADEFEAAGVPTAYCDMDTPADERRKIGERLRNGQIKVVANVYTLTTGVDWDVRCIVLARPTKSEILFVQIVGRGLRTAEGKRDCLILDHSDTTLKLGFPADIHHAYLDEGKHKESSNARKEKATPLPKECPKCSYLKPAGILQCAQCGFVPERQSQIAERDGQLIQLNGKRRTKAEGTPHSQQDVYSMLLWIVQERGYKPGYAAAKFKDRYGIWPPRHLMALPKPPDAIFMNWLKSRNIAYARARKKADAHAA
ncbi:MAG: DEAD/DEAH box helicase [Rhizobiaceae bacterium]